MEPQVRGREWPDDMGRLEVGGQAIIDRFDGGGGIVTEPEPKTALGTADQEPRGVQPVLGDDLDIRVHGDRLQRIGEKGVAEATTAHAASTVDIDTGDVGAVDGGVVHRSRVTP